MAEADSNRGGLNPLTWVTMIAAATLAGLFVGPWYWVGTFAVAVLLAALIGNLKQFFAVFAVALLPLGALMAVLQFFFSGGEDVLVEWWIFQGTREGLSNAITFVTRLFVIGTGVLLITNVVDLHRVSRALEQKGLSPRATYVLQSTFLIIPEMQKRASTIMDAQRSRGIETDGGVLVRARALLPALAPLILSSLTGVEERAISLEARGMTLQGPKTSLLRVPDTGLDVALRCLSVLAVLAVIGWKVWTWLA